MKYKDISRYSFEFLMLINCIPKGAIIEELPSGKIRIFYNKGCWHV